MDSAVAQLIGIWIAALLTLAIYSFLYKDNPFYKFTEHLAVGLSVGFFLVVYWFNFIKPKLIDNIAAGQFWYIIPLILGLFLFLRLIPNRFGWLSRWSVAFYLGGLSGISLPATMEGRVIAQIKGNILPIFSLSDISNTFKNAFAASGIYEALKIIFFNTTFCNIVVVVGVLCTLMYFFFSKEHKGLWGGMAKIGIFYIMIGFGASFGYTVMGRVSLLIGRMQFLLRDWLHLLK